MRFSFLLVSVVTLLFSCNSNSHEDLSSEELMQLAIQKAEEEKDNIAMQAEELAPAEASPTEEKIDSIQIILDGWHRDFTMFTGISKEPDSIDVNFSGVYELNNGDYHFTLSMGQSSIYLRGSYCGYTNTKSDCGMQSQGVADPLIKGRVVNDTAYIYYYSNYAHDFGRAKIYLEGDSTLIWKATDTPESMFIGTPDEGKLKLIKERQEDYEVWPDPNMEGC